MLSETQVDRKEYEKNYEEGDGANGPLAKEVIAMEFHEVCLAFPLMDDEAFKELCDDIRANGLRNPIITSALIGASSVRQLEDNLGTLQRLDFSEEDLAAIEQSLKG